MELRSHREIPSAIVLSTPFMCKASKHHPLPIPKHPKIRISAPDRGSLLRWPNHTTSAVFPDGDRGSGWACGCKCDLCFVRYFQAESWQPTWSSRSAKHLLDEDAPAELQRSPR